MKLYGHPDSGHAYKVALALRFSGIEYEYEFVDIWAPRETRPPEFLAASKWGEVPCLVIDGTAHIQSGAILLKLAREHNALFPRAHLDQLAEWIIWEANRIGMCVPQLIHALRVPKEAPPPVQDWLKARYQIDIARLDAALEGAPFLLGEALSLADLCVFGYMSKAHLAKLDTPPNVRKWLHAIMAHERYMSAETLLARSQAN